MFALQRDRWILWLPVAMVAGAAAWMLAPRQPPVWLGTLALLAGATAAITATAWASTRSDGFAMALRRAAAGLCALCAAAGLGAVAAQVRAASVAQPAFVGSEMPVTDRLGAILGLSPSEIERLAPPEDCSEALCRWRRARGDIFFVRESSAIEQACAPHAVVISQAPAPNGFAQRCNLDALADSASIAALGGGAITETPLGLRIARARPARVQRPWTPRSPAPDQE